MLERKNRIRMEVFNRVEKKYLLDDSVYQQLVKRLEEKMELDAYHKGQRFYSIANIYYDTPSDELIRNSLERPIYKEKLRLRSYGVPRMEDLVFLEIKKKFGGVVNKRRTEFVLSEAYQYLHNRKPLKKSDSNINNRQVLQEIDVFLKRYNLQPKVFLAYDRVAFFGKEDRAFRVTFDTHIRARRERVRLEEGMEGTPLLEQGVWLMEVKITGAAPLWFTRLLSEYRLYATSFSKYGMEYKEYLLQKNLLKGEESLCLKQFLHQPVRPSYPFVQQY